MISFRVPRELKDDLNRVLGWGFQRPVFEALTRELVEFLKTSEGKLFVGLLSRGEATFADFIRVSQEMKNPTSQDS